MGAPVRLARRARKDLQEIVAFIAQDDPIRAVTFGDTLLNKAQRLGHHPRMGRVVPERGDEEVREIVHGAYRIIYRVTANPERIFVLRFWHAARGAPQIVED